MIRDTLRSLATHARAHESLSHDEITTVVVMVAAVVAFAMIFVIRRIYFRLKYVPGKGRTKTFDLYDKTFMSKGKVIKVGMQDIDHVCHARLIASSFTTANGVIKARYTIEYYLKKSPA